MQKTDTELLSEFQLPITTAPSIYTSRFRKALAEFCVPLDEARAGDCVAVMQSFKFTEDNDAYVDPMDAIVVATGRSDQPFVIKLFSTLSREMLSSVAPGVLLAQTLGLREYELLEHTLALNCALVECVIAPDFLLAANQHYIRKLGHLHIQNQVPTQHTIQECFLAILPEVVDTAHCAIEKISLAEQITRLSNSVFQIRHSVKAEPTHRLRPPDLGALFTM